MDRYFSYVLMSTLTITLSGIAMIVGLIGKWVFFIIVIACLIGLILVMLKNNWI